MKKIRILLTGIFVLCASALFAGSIDYLSNQSADYMRTFSRNAATSGADIAVYNPAATAFLAPGMYFQLSNQSIFKVYENDFSPNATGTSLGLKADNYKTTKPTYFLPSFFAIMNGGKWAAFVDAGVVGGGGAVDYKDGVPTMQLAALKISQQYGGIAVQFKEGSLKADSMFPQITVGGSYAINDMFSVSLGLRGVWGEKSFEGSASYDTAAGPVPLSLDAEKKAFGVGAIIGVEAKPVENMVVAVRYETQTKLEWKTTVNDGKNFGGMFVDGEKKRQDLPAMIGAGVSYTFMDALTVSTSFDGFFIGQSDQDSDTKVNADGYDDDYANFGWEASVGVQYIVVPQFLEVSCGYMYNDLGGNEDTYNDFDFSLDSNSFGLGAKISALPNLDFTLALARIMYTSCKVDNVLSTGTNVGTTNYKKYANVVAVAAEYKIQ